jgi:cell division protein FtsQ
LEISPAHRPERRRPLDARSRPRAAGRLTWSAVVVFAVVGAASLAVHSPLFRARTIDISGISHLTRAQVVRAAGVSSATNVFFADTSAIEARLQAQPWVAEATVVRALPSTLRIVIAERRPVVAVDDGAAFRLLAGDGTLLAVAHDDEGLPVVRRPAARARRTVTLTPSDAAAALAPLPPAVGDDVAAVAESAGGGLILRMRSGGAIEYGPPGAAGAKADALAALLRWSSREGRSIDRADVSVPAAPTARLRGSGRRLSG